jgi:hypothetical protein
LDLDQKTWEDHKLNIVAQKTDVEDQKKKLEYRVKAKHKT